MTKPSPEIEALAAERLAADEARMASRRRRSVSLTAAWREFWRHPTPWMMLTVLIGAGTARCFVDGFSWTELIAPGLFVLFFPVIEWLIHVFILHWRPVRVLGVTMDPLVSRKHREHHVDPRDLPLVFIPWQVMVWLMVSVVAIGLFAFPDAAGLTFVLGLTLVGFAYEWMHYLIHSDYRPRSRWYRSVWRDHRLHHYKNEHYWFTVTTSGTADRLLGTYPDPATVAKSPTARQLWAQETEKPLA